MNEKIDILDEGYISLWSVDGLMEFPLLRRIVVDDKVYEYDCVDSYSLIGGPHEPFEKLSIIIPKKKLATIAPMFAEPHSIVPGRTRISVNYYGRSLNMIVTKYRTSGESITLTAYHECEVIRGLPTQGSSEQEYVPKAIVMLLNLLDSALGYSNHFGNVTEGGHTRMVYDSAFWDSTPFSIHIPAGMNVWTALQTLAMVMGCRVFFAGDYAYILDYRRQFAMDEVFNDIPVLSLFPPESAAAMYAAVTSTPDYGDEGFDTVENLVEVSGVAMEIESQGGVDLTLESIMAGAPLSISRYGQRCGAKINTEFLSIPLCVSFGSAYLDYMCEPQQSVTFTVKEIAYDSAIKGGIVWTPLFRTMTRIGKIINTVDSITIDNADSLGNTTPQKLYLAQYERSYPEGTSTYAFGVTGDVNLAQSTSQIIAALGSLSNL